MGRTTDATRDPVLDAWMTECLGHPPSGKIDQMTEMLAITSQGRRGQVPSEVLRRWRLQLVVNRWKVLQSERELLEACKAQRLTWEQTAQVLGVADITSAHHRVAEMEDEYTRHHPDRRASEWAP